MFYGILTLNNSIHVPSSFSSCQNIQKRLFWNFRQKILWTVCFYVLCFIWFCISSCTEMLFLLSLILSFCIHMTPFDSQSDQFPDDKSIEKLYWKKKKKSSQIRTQNRSHFFDAITNFEFNVIEWIGTETETETIYTKLIKIIIKYITRHGTAWYGGVCLPVNCMHDGCSVLVCLCVCVCQ